MATLALWCAAWVLIGQQLRRSDAFAKVVSAKSGPIALARVPGGVARRVTTSPATMIQEVVWSSDSRYVLYTATPELSIGKIMRVSSASGNPFDVNGNNKRMQREMLQMMAPQVRYYDLRTRDSGQIIGTWPPHLHPLGEFSVSPDGRYLALTLADYSQISSVEEQFEAQREVYVVPLDKDFRLGEPRHIGQATQFHWLPDSRRLLYLRADGPQAGTYLASVDGGQARLLDTEHTEYRLRGIAADQTVAYCTFSRKDRNLLGQGWALRHLNLQSGRFRDVPLRNGPSQLGPLRRDEAPFVHRPDGDEGPTQIAAVDFATGQVRWLRRDLKGRFWGAKRLLGGRALLLATSSASETGDTQTQFAVLSLHDGKVRLFPPLRLPARAPEKWWVSPDGLAVALQSSGMRMTGLDPFSMLRETLWVAKLTDAWALLSGPGQ